MAGAGMSLDAISPDNVLELSHLGVIAGMVDALGLDADIRRQVLVSIGEKNADGIRKLCPDTDIEGLLELVAAHGEPDAVISRLRPWCAHGLARAALDELAAVADVLGGLGRAVQLDFSIVNDMNYYNGIVFRGYIQGIPSGVLSGGQYDRLMQRMGRTSRAVGFAIYTDLLERLGNEGRDYDVDTLLLYPEDADALAIAKTVRELSESGASVLAVRCVPERLRYRQLIHFDGAKGGDAL